MLRALARHYVPAGVRLQIALLRRGLHDLRSRPRFAEDRGDPSNFPHLICSYSRPFIDYPGQEKVAAAKRANQALLASHLTNRVIRPGQFFSVWRLAPRPTGSNGYAPAAALRDGHLTMEVGGAICLLSTVLYNVALLGALEIVERHCHSVDSYGDARYFELGRDAAIEYGYLDLRFRNPHRFAVILTVDVTETNTTSTLRAEHPAGFHVRLEVDKPGPLQASKGPRTRQMFRAEPPRRGMLVRAKRTIEFVSGDSRVEALPDSVHYFPRRS